MTAMNIHAFTCFGHGEGGGNPALVIERGPADAAQRAALSRIGPDLFVTLARQAAPRLDIDPALPGRLLAAPALIHDWAARTA